MVWIAPQTPPDERPHPDAAAMRDELADLRVYLADADAYDPESLRRMRAREARLVSLIGESDE